MTFEELVLKHRGKKILVIGGGRATKSDVKKIKPDVIISANEHGAKICEPDYVVSMDDVHTVDKDNMRDRIRALTDAPIIGPFSHYDVVLTTWPMAPRRVYTGTVAVWVAFTMGAKVVVTLGFDGYEDEDGDMRPGYAEKVIEVSKQVKVPIRTVKAGPALQEYWPEYDPKETFGRFKPHESLKDYHEDDGYCLIKARKDTKLDDGLLRKNDVRRVLKNNRTVVRQLKHKMIEVVYKEDLENEE